MLIKFWSGPLVLSRLLYPRVVGCFGANLDGNLSTPLVGVFKRLTASLHLLLDGVPKTK